jgi:hypothetical protein
MMMSRRHIGVALATVTIGLAACGGGGSGGDATGTTKAAASVASVSPTAASQPAPSIAEAPTTTQAPATTQGAPATQSPNTTMTPAVVVPLMPAPTCPSAGATGSSTNSKAPLVCLDLFGGLRWGAVVQTDLTDDTRQALMACADELTETLTSIGNGKRFALPHCDAATTAVATTGSEPYVALIQQQLEDCRLPLAQYASDLGDGVTYDAAKAEVLVNEIFACKSVIEGFATTRP